MGQEPNVLIIGANRGLGLEWTRQWLARDASVYATARQPDAARDLQQLKQEAGDRLSIHPVDVASDDSVARLAEELAGIPLDVMIHNAGIGGHDGLENLDTDRVRHLFNTNSVGALRTVGALRGNLRQAPGRAKVALITSLMGSIGDNRSGGSYAYRMSKAALNMAGKSMAVDLADDGIDVFILHPGWVRTDMGGPSARISPEESVSGMMELLDNLTPGHSGSFWHTDGRQLPW